MQQKRGSVGFLVTCLVDLMRPEIGLAAIRLLEHAGFSVAVPAAQTCCGQPAYNAGDRPLARKLGQKVLCEFEGFDYLVVPSGSCAGQVKLALVELFGDDPDLKARATRLAAKTYELTDFLVSVAGLQTVPGTFRGRVTYHDSCTGLRDLGVQAQPRKLLALLPDLRLAEMENCRNCCGFGGTFAVKFGEISGAIVDEKCRDIRATGADAVVLGDLGCILNIEGRLRRLGDSTRVLHIAQVLTERG